MILFREEHIQCRCFWFLSFWEWRSSWPEIFNLFDCCKVSSFLLIDISFGSVTSTWFIFLSLRNVDLHSVYQATQQWISSPRRRGRSCFCSHTQHQASHQGSNFSGKLTDHLPYIPDLSHYQIFKLCDSTFLEANSLIVIMPRVLKGFNLWFLCCVLTFNDLLYLKRELW